MCSALDSYDIVGGPLDWGPLNDPFVSTTRKNLYERDLPMRDGVRQPVGANMAFRRSVFDGLGGFDEAFVSAADDIDFMFRATEHGFTVGFVPEAVVSYRLRATPRDAARQAANYTLAVAQFRAKNGITQPWKAKLLRAAWYGRMLMSVWRCRTRAGRFEYLKNLAAARAAILGYLRYQVVG
jgi:GT2 family glycosyltransferase